MEAGYSCKACGAPAEVVGQDIYRSCEHKTTIIASMKATARGVGRADANLSGGPLAKFMRALGLILGIIKAARKT